MESDAPVSAQKAAFSPQTVKKMELDIKSDDSAAYNFTQLTTVLVSSVNLLHFGHL